MKKENELNDEINEFDILDDDISLDIDSDVSNELLNNDYNSFDVFYKFNTNKHKQDGKHALNRDTITNGKLIKKDDDVDSEFKNQDSVEKITIKYETGSAFEFESKYYEDYINQKNLSIDVHEVLSEKTDIDFMQNRRKPNKEKFNQYFNIVYNELSFKYHKYEIFIELSLYFTDNIFNTFKLLDKDIISSIIKEMIKKGYFQNLENIKFL